MTIKFYDNENTIDYTLKLRDNVNLIEIENIIHDLCWENDYIEFAYKGD